MGKGVGDDFRDGKVTLPVILAYARGSESERAFWRAAMAVSARATSDLAEATACSRAPARWPTRSSAPACSASAPSTRSGRSPAGRAKAALVEAVEFAVARAY